MSYRGEGQNRVYSRRGLLGGAAALTAVEAYGADDAATGDRSRENQSYQLRVEAARLERDSPRVSRDNNGDEDAFPNRIGNFSKGLPHNPRGEVDPTAYSALVHALQQESQSALERVPMGVADSLRQRKFVNPCAGAAFDPQGADSHHLSIAPAPGVTSAETAGEMVELYWQALARDVAFSEYDSNLLTQMAAADMSRLSTFRGPKANGRVTTSTLFRGFTSGDTVGPYISQFLLKPVPFGVQFVEQRMRAPVPAIDFGTRFADWLNIQNGSTPDEALHFDTQRRFIRNGRDLGQWVHIDVLYQAYFNAMLILLHPPDPGDELTGGGMGAPLNPGNPYAESRTQEGFGTFGAPGIATAVAEIATRALKAVWYQKWFVHRRLRPEAYGGLVDVTMNSGTRYPVHNDVLNSAAVSRVQSAHGTALLPLAFPEGSPLHPSYGAGHATVAGAAVTILKALFDETTVIPNPVVPSGDGLSLIPYKGADAGRLTVGGELNKLASNVAIGRNFAGVHWRSDYAESLKLGEAVAISILRDQKRCYTEDFDGYTFTRFDGRRVTV